MESVAYDVPSPEPCNVTRPLEGLCEKWEPYMLCADFPYLMSSETNPILLRPIQVCLNSSKLLDTSSLGCGSSSKHCGQSLVHLLKKHSQHPDAARAAAEVIKVKHTFDTGTMLELEVQYFNAKHHHAASRDSCNANATRNHLLMMKAIFDRVRSLNLCSPCTTQKTPQPIVQLISSVRDLDVDVGSSKARYATCLVYKIISLATEILTSVSVKQIGRSQKSNTDGTSLKRSRSRAQIDGKSCAYGKTKRRK